MTQDPRMPEGAGAQGRTGTATTGTTTTTTVGGSGSHYTPGQHSSSETGSYSQDDQYRSRNSGREVILADRSRTPSTATLVGAAIAGAVAGAAIPFMLSGRSGSSRSTSGRSEDTTVEESITVNRPARELYDFWRNFENLSQFMDNIKSVTKIDERRSHWVIKAPAGTSVEFDSYVTEEQPGRLIAWRSEEDASVPNSGRVEFIEQGGGSTLVRTRISYDPPAGAAGRLVAKLFQREPGTQARQDLTRFKELMEKGGVSA